jgi:hypothetical protein
MAEVPTVDEVRKWLKLAATSMDDVELGDVLDGEVANQARVCRLPEVYPADLRQAVFRRCGREVGARGVPLGLTSADEYGGQARLPAFDAEIERLERPLRRLVFG